MHYQKNGFALLTVLIFMQLFSMMSLTTLTTASFIQKSNHHQWQAYTTRLFSERILKKIELTLMPDSPCIIPIIPAPILAQKSLEWWQLHACHNSMNTRFFYYTVEYLGADPCAIIEKSNHTASYYRVSLYVLPDKGEDNHDLLQSTLILPVEKTVNCQQTHHAVKAGRQSFRNVN